jgi:DNA replication protein DnaC/DNA-directed RNA polymerase subunit RPC12/RpoP
MAIMGLFNRNKGTEDHQDNSLDKNDNSKKELSSENSSKMKTEELPDEGCKFCYESFENGDNAYKCTNCGTHYHYPICLKSQANCRVCGEKIVEKGNVMILVNTLHAICPKCKTKIKLDFTLEPKIGVKCSSCGSEGKIPNPYLKAVKSKRKKPDDSLEEFDIDKAVLKDTTEPEVITTSSVKLRKPKLVIMEESIPCHVCLGAIKTGLPVVVCRCGKKYHESCANRVASCPICDADLTDYEPVDDLVRTRSEKFGKGETESPMTSASELSQEPTPEPEPAPPEPEPASAAATEPEPEQSVPEPTPGPLEELDTNYTFDNYTVNDQNRIIHSIAHGIAEAPGYEFKLLFFHGEKGFGKTHLLQAIGNYVKNKNCDLNAIYFPTKDFFSEMDQVIDNGNQKEFENNFKNMDIILLDDFHEVPKNKAGQEMIGKLFDDLLKNGKQIVIASEKPINDINALDKNLSKLFQDGLNIKLKSPSHDLRQEILRKHVSGESAKLFDELMKSAEIKDNVDLGSLKKKLSQLILTSKIQEQEEN